MWADGCWVLERDKNTGSQAGCCPGSWHSLWKQWAWVGECQGTRGLVSWPASYLLHMSATACRELGRLEEKGQHMCWKNERPP